MDDRELIKVFNMECHSTCVVSRLSLAAVGLIV